MRHPEVGQDFTILFQIVGEPDEVYLDERNGVHALKAVKNNRYVVVIYESTDNEGFIRTAYVTSNSRKNRRYRKLRQLKLY